MCTWPWLHRVCTSHGSVAMTRDRGTVFLEPGSWQRVKRTFFSICRLAQLALKSFKNTLPAHERRGCADLIPCPCILVFDLGPSINKRSPLSYNLTNIILETQRSYQTKAILQYMQTHASIEIWGVFQDIYDRQTMADGCDQHGEETDDTRAPIDSATMALDGIIRQLPSLLCDRREGMDTNVKLYMEHLCDTLQGSTFPPNIEAAKEALSIAMHYSDVMLSINT